MSARRTRSLLALTLAIGGAASVASLAGATTTCAAPPTGMHFTEPGYVDTTHAGGEPMVQTHPSGRILYSSHAGTTHFYSPDAGSTTTVAFPDHYTGQTYVWYSDDDGKTWHFVNRSTPPDNVAGSGFSDPDFAIDSAGNVYFSEINLANVAVSRSTDRGTTYKLQNFFGQTVTDRQWSEADRPGELYLVGDPEGGGTSTNPVGNSGHYLYKSVDGGVTFTKGVNDNGGFGDLRVDRSRGILYEAHENGGTLQMAAFPKARSGDFTPRVSPIAEGVSMIAHWPSFDVDKDGNLYIAWDESGKGARPAGIYYSASRDQGQTWLPPVALARGAQTKIWPWVAVGDDGRVAVAWLQADVALPGNDAETTGQYGWRIYAAQSLDGLGCGKHTTPGFRVSRLTSSAIHQSTICQGGTACQATATDRRLGDYFSIEIDGHGHLYAAYGDTRKGGAVSLPGFTRQIGGPSFFAR